MNHDKIRSERLAAVPITQLRLLNMMLPLLLPAILKNCPLFSPQSGTVVPITFSSLTQQPFTQITNIEPSTMKLLLIMAEALLLSGLIAPAVATTGSCTLAQQATGSCCAGFSYKNVPASWSSCS